MEKKVSWFIRLSHDRDPDVYGIGECGPLPGLSPDAVPDFENVLQDILQQVTRLGELSLPALLRLVPQRFPSIVFGLETAFHDLRNGGKRIIFENDFIRGKAIPINGLIWMGETDFMLDQISRKVEQGFRCLKLKIGGLDFDRECMVLEQIRERYRKEEIMLRLDANGAFESSGALYKLKALSAYDVHSIEQPVQPGLPVMEELCRNSPIPIALDEELIGIDEPTQKLALLRKLKPHYIILKPTLHGGFAGCDEWIRLADNDGIGWWITSALESGIGLNAVCQFTATYPVETYQGLGTGGIYHDNFTSPLTVTNGMISYDAQRSWNEHEFLP